jgi:hypothetical protein
MLVVTKQQRIANLVDTANDAQQEWIHNMTEVHGITLNDWPMHYVEALLADRLGFNGVDTVYADAAATMHSSNWSRCSFVLFMVATYSPHYLVDWIVARKEYLANGDSARDVAECIKKYYTGQFNGKEVIDLRATIEARKEADDTVHVPATTYRIDVHYDADDDGALTYCANLDGGLVWFPKPHVEFMLAVEDMKQWAKVLDGRLAEKAFRRAPYPKLD